MADTDSLQSNRRDAAIIDPHLPEGYSADPEALVSDPVQPDTRSGVSEMPEESSLMLQGGDIHRDIYKIKAKANAPRRSATFSGLNPRYQDEEQPRADDIMQPGGFRRQHVQRNQTEIPNLRRRLSRAAVPVTKNFIGFLELYGDFAGEDLADTDTDDESAIDDNETRPLNDERDERPTERRPLLGKRKSTRRLKQQGDASTTKTFFTLLKAFVGTGILFLPKAFRNGGILASSITLVMVSFITCLCFRLLLQCREKCGGGGYGELGGAIVGRRFRSLVLASITLSQLGFVCAGIIFTAENMYSFFQAVLKSRNLPVGINTFIALQLILLIPLALIRNISKLGPAALLADVFILIGVVYIWQYDIRSLAEFGVNESVQLFSPSTFPLTIGSAIFTFEGIGLILPIQSSMKQPEHFSKLLYLIMFIITIIFASIGALCYATFGEFTQIQIISNFPQDSKLVNAVQFLYSLAVLAGNPVQLFPAVRIVETSLFGEKATGKRSATIKWKKNMLRAGAMCLCGVVAVVGASDLDKFVAIIGSAACVPLVYIYPAFLHYKGVAETRGEKAFDIGMMLLGVVAMGYTTLVTVAQWVT
jgi:proton-coupled amino acid transporter